MKYAEMHNNVIVTLRSAPYPSAPAEPVTIAVPDEVELGWVRAQDGTFSPGPAALRAQERAALAAQFMAEPDSFLGPFFNLFQSITPLLDAHRDAAAELLIRSSAAPAWFTPEEQADFAQKRDDYADAVHDLTKLNA